jgi:prepilin-type N-terminal cleavage/methylation domain-containing protein
VMPYKVNMSKKGFTLVEILVVIVIILLITAFTLIVIESARNKTKNAIILTSLEQIQAIAETSYNAEDGYKELSKMRPHVHDITQDYYTLNQIRQKIEEMGSTARIFFPIDGATGGYEDYCAYALVMPRSSENIVFCIDSLGNKVVAPIAKINCGKSGIPANCLNM